MGDVARRLRRDRGARPAASPARFTFGAWGAEQDVPTSATSATSRSAPTARSMVVYQTPTGNEGPVEHHRAHSTPTGSVPAASAAGGDCDGHERRRVRLPARATAALGRRRVRPGVGPHRRRERRADLPRVHRRGTRPRATTSTSSSGRSDDDGANWSAPVQVNDDAGTNTQMLPKIALDQTNGDVAVTFYDARGDTGGGPERDRHRRHGQQRRHARSRRGASTAARRGPPTSRSPMRRPTATTTTAPRSSATTPGSAFHGGVLYPSWADSSNSTGDNPGGTRVTFDVYVAAVRPRQRGAGRVRSRRRPAPRAPRSTSPGSASDAER